MTHEEWMKNLKSTYDPYNRGFRSTHWGWIKFKHEYFQLIEQSRASLFYIIAVRN